MHDATIKIKKDKNKKPTYKHLELKYLIWGI
jgi:hypothetical protein